MSLLAAALALAIKDLRAELRSRAAIVSALLLAALTLAIFQFARDPTELTTALLAPSALWITSTFAATTALNRAFAAEVEHGAIDALLLAPIPREAIFAGKFLANLAFALAIELLAAPLVVLFFNVDPGPHALGVLGTLALATVGFVAVGTVFGAMTVRARYAELLLPVLVFPFLLLPVVAGVQVTVTLLHGGGFGEVGGWVRLLFVYDVTFVVLSVLVFPALLDE